MLALKDYGSSDEEGETENITPMLPSVKQSVSTSSLQICPAPEVVPTETELCVKRYVDPTTIEIRYNSKYEELFGSEVGSQNPFETPEQCAIKNTPSDYIEPVHLNEYFENQRRTFSREALAKYAAEESSGKRSGVFENTVFRLSAKRKKQTEEKLQQAEEKTALHIKDSVDYQGRSFLHPPQNIGVNLRSESPPDRCFLPKAQIHTWEGHTKGISKIRWFPHTAHLLLSCSLDCKVKLWEVYKDRRCVRTYYGHRQAVRDISFDNDGKRFLSAAYDRYVKLWDTETGVCISRFISRKIPYCVKFNPDADKQHLFVAGTSDKIICWDIRSGKITQEYDLDAVNTITFVDENRFVTTSDDKSLRVWEWDIPVDVKYITDQSMYSMPAVTPSRNQKWLACQSMDNKIVTFSTLNRFKINPKKTFTGHMVAGYACGLDFSPDMSYLVSGDADGKCYIWYWKTTKLWKKWKAHDGVCIDVLWHPHEPSKIATAGWDGKIKYWD